MWFSYIIGSGIEFSYVIHWYEYVCLLFQDTTLKGLGDIAKLLSRESVHPQLHSDLPGSRLSLNLCSTNILEKLCLVEA